MTTHTKVAVVTGASQGLGLALAHELAGRGWSLVLDARHRDVLEAAAAELVGGPHRVVAGDVTDGAHRQDLADAAAGLGGARALVNNASSLGAPLGPLRSLDPSAYRRLLDVNLVAPVALASALLPQLLAAASGTGVVVDVSSDAGVAAYETWGGYGSSKAALDHASRTLAAEEPGLRVYAVDPGDLRTAMHQAAFPGEDIGDRPLPATVAPALADLLESARPSGRYRLAELGAAA
jgi:NAD(P)-dependent dehydrogenase (short-subunit alcohol dehydrogenase family)